MNALEEANDIIHGERNKAYGHPLDNHSTTAAMWSSYLERKYGMEEILDARDVCMMNILQKVSRDANMEKRDNVVDIIGYGGNIDMIDEKLKERSTQVKTSG